MKIKEMYDKYLWKKCWLSLFYKRIYSWIPFEEAIKPVERDENDIRSKRFWEELKRYYEQPDPKPDKRKFYWRLFKWYSKEEAIKEELVLKERKKPVRKDAYIPTYSQPITQADDHEIRITYDKEEAKIIRKTYERMIDDLERTIVEDEWEAKTLQTKIDELKTEFFIFNKYNHE